MVERRVTVHKKILTAEIIFRDSPRPRWESSEQRAHALQLGGKENVKGEFQYSYVLPLVWGPARFCGSFFFVTFRSLLLHPLSDLDHNADFEGLFLFSMHINILYAVPFVEKGLIRHVVELQ